MFCAKKSPLGVAVTDFGEMFPDTESSLASTRSPSGIVVVVVVGAAVVVVLVVGAVDVVVVVGATVVVVGATVDVVVTGAATTSLAWF